MDERHNIKTNTNAVSKLFFLNSFRLFKLGLKKNIEVDHVHSSQADISSEKLGTNFELNWNKLNDTEEKINLARVLWNCYGKIYILCGMFQMLIDVFILVLQPYLFGKVVSYFTPGQIELTKNEALVDTIILVFTFFFRAIYRNNYVFFMRKFGIKIRTALCSFIYRKSLKLDPNYIRHLSEGKMLTLLTKDVETLEACAVVGNDLWISVVSVAVSSCILYLRMGLAGLVGIGCFLAGILLQFCLSAKVKTLKIEMCNKSDKRLQIIHETTSYIRLIKMYTWETFFQRKIHKARTKEINTAFKMFIMRFAIFTIGFISVEVAFYLTLITYTWFGNNITGDITYFAINIYSLIVPIFIETFPNVIFKISESLSALKRIEEAFRNDDLQKKESDIKTTDSPLIICQNLCLSINNKKVLNKIDLNLNKRLTIISGPIGSGKSIFLKTILQEYAPNEGILKVNGSVAYASQEPWLFPATIQKNILFGQDYESKRYEEVLRICGLIYDLNLFEKGDSTIVESNGANLSRGQQTRINLARAVYRNSDIYLLDDPLSGLDVNVATFVFEECILNFLKDKVVVLVTHNADYFKEASEIIYFDNGCIKTNKSVESRIPTENKTFLNNISTDLSNNEDEDNGINESVKLIKPTKTNIYHEKRKFGKVDLQTYLEYANIGGGPLAIFLIFSTQILMNVGLAYRLKFVGDWVDTEEAIIFNPISTDKSIAAELEVEHKNAFFTYSSLVAFLAVAAVVRAIVTLAFTRISSVKIHKKMIHNIIHSGSEFFDKVFVGNILNRFSKDITIIDEFLPFTIFGFVRAIITMFATVILIAFVNNVFLIPIGILFVTMYLCRKYTIKTTTNVKRLEVSIRGPVIGHIDATMKGYTTIRAFGGEDTVKNEFDNCQDIYASTSCAYAETSNAFTFILDIISTTFTSIIIIIFLFIKNDAKAGYVGLAISQALLLAEALNKAFFCWSDLENQMTSVERALEYTNIKQETQNGVVIENWPKVGKITLENVRLCYPSSNEYVLKDINFTSQPGEKIGIVGRTGAGKSSLVSVLFRLYEIEGKISIDDVDLKTLSLEFLRSNISIIPQEPFLFSGTIRHNIDPFGKYSDEDIWAAIEKVDLKKIVLSLDTEIGTDSMNLSVGQKQLLSIARAIIQKKKIVILDEATANTDIETEKLIYGSIEANFFDCTVLTIAHKLHTVLNSDRIIVLENGVITECGKPAILMENKNGEFYKMVQKAGLTLN